MLNKLYRYWLSTAWTLEPRFFSPRQDFVDSTRGWLSVNLTPSQYRICLAVSCLADEILKGQHQMYADYLLLELVERGEI